MNESSKVSIVIPIYNAQKYLRECLDSIISQTYKNIEIICVDDGSVDSSRDIVSEYMCADRRVMLFREQHKNAGYARNVGMQHARGEFIVFLDADDIFNSKLIEKHVNRMLETDADITICSCRGYDEEKKYYYDLGRCSLNLDYLPEKDIFSYMDIPDHIFQITNTWVWDKMYRKSFLIENILKFQELKAINDAYFCSMSNVMAKNISIVNDELIIHRSNVKTSIEYTRGKSWECAFIMLEKLKRDLNKYGYYDAVERSFINLAAERITYYVLSIKDEEEINKAYDYCKSTAVEKYRFLDYNKGYYHDENVRFLLGTIRRTNLTGYLLTYSALQERTIRNFSVLVDRINANHSIQVKNMDNEIKRKSWSIPKCFLHKGRYVIYGFGDVGKDYYRQLSRDRDIEIVGVVDEKQNGENIDGIQIYSLDNLKDLVFDEVVVAIASESIANVIRQNLIEVGVGEEKIIWAMKC